MPRWSVFYLERKTTPRWVRQLRKRGVDLYTYDHADEEIQRRCSVVWMNNEDWRRFRYIPKAHPDRPSDSGAWMIFDRKAEKFLDRSEVMALGFAQCCEEMSGPEIKMQ
jgi:hypothetical protein